MLHYYTPKPARTLKRERGKPPMEAFSIEPHDIAMISHSQAHEVPWAWSALAVGGNRHLSLAQRLSAYPTIEKLEAAKLVKKRKGVITGDGRLHFPEQEGKPMLAA